MDARWATTTTEARRLLVGEFLGLSKNGEQIVRAASLQQVSKWNYVSASLRINLGKDAPQSLDE